MLRILLNELVVGELRRTKGGRTEFRFLPAYLEGAHRPVLSQSFLDRERETFEGSVSRLPAFFRNLLPDPDGRHRIHVAHELGVKTHQEFVMLARLGEDLTGAVRVEWDGEADDFETDDDGVHGNPVGAALAGVQPKFSAVREGASFRWSRHGRSSEFLTKPPDAELPGIPENEFSMMLWAKACGIDTAECTLTSLDQIDDVPEWLGTSAGNALVVRRFDRADGRRIHIEDMAQAWGLQPDEKYEKRHYAAIANLLLAFGDHAGFADLVRRIVFMAASGNADGHLKNFSLIYENPLRPRLAPAYDLVSTIQYPGYDNSGLGLKLGGVREWSRLTENVFRRFAEKLPVSTDEVVALVRNSAGQIREAWGRVRADLPLPELQKAIIERHWEAIPILRGG